MNVGMHARNTTCFIGKLVLVCLKIMASGLQIGIFLPECSTNLKLYLLKVLHWPNFYIISVYKIVTHLKSAVAGMS